MSDRLSANIGRRGMNLVTDGTTGGGAGGMESLGQLTDRIVRGMDDQSIRDIIIRLERELNPAIYGLKQEVDSILENLGNNTHSILVRNLQTSRLGAIKQEIDIKVNDFTPIITKLIYCGYSKDIQYLLGRFSICEKIQNLISSHLPSQESQQ